jgi:V/A-type H+-transporting ATPase subunit I
VSVVALKKVTLVGLASDKDRALADLQSMGCLHLIPLSDSPGETPHEGPSSRSGEALKFLIGCPSRWRQSSLTEEFDPSRVEERALEIRNRLLDLRDRKDSLVERIDTLAPFGEFDFPDPDDLAGLRVWLYAVPDGQVKRFKPGKLASSLVSRVNHVSYFVVLSATEPEGLPVPPVDVGHESLRTLEKKLEKVEMEIEDLRAERAGLSRWLTLYMRNLDRMEDRAALEHVKSLCRDDELLFAVQGWVRETDVPALRRYTADNDMTLQVADPGPDDTPPVALDNPRRLSFGEQLLAFYQLPGYGDWDPSSIVFLSFAVFFGLILADAAYGALLGIVLLLLWKRLGKSESGRGFRRLMTAIVSASVILGVMLGSYFGLSPEPGSWLARLKVFDINDFGSMMRLSILIGGVHIILASLRTAWHRRRSLSALAPLGWALITGGGLVTFVGLETDAVKVGAGMIVAGALGVLLFSGTRPVRGFKGAAGRFVDGLKGLAGFSGLFGDVLSYLRLFALGLASASLAVTFNGLASQVSGAGGGRGIAVFGALLILVVGHALNLTLGVISGVVHGLRLNLIEFYKWSVFEEGSAFRAFRKKEK